MKSFLISLWYSGYFYLSRNTKFQKKVAVSLPSFKMSLFLAIAIAINCSLFKISFFNFDHILIGGTATG